MSAKGEVRNDAIPEQHPNMSRMAKSDHKLYYFPSQTIEYYYHGEKRYDKVESIEI
jgi:hypothetical protein